MSALRPGKLVVPIAALALAWLVSGCSHTERVGANRTLRIALTEYRLNPQSARVSAGQLTVFVQNYGRLTHNLVISGLGQEQGSTRPLPPGASSLITLDLKAGKYIMASTILDDEALGEYGTLTVTS